MLLAHQALKKLHPPLISHGIIGIGQSIVLIGHLKTLESFDWSAQNFEEF